ncbi:MAG: DUF4389 domain-containing protein [Gammaproteobacteria bacterium]|nr:DUF4389 domain-containing protein [Gammaproteobacteria bacterium]
MKENTRENLVRRDIWIRALYMLLFAIVYSVAEAIIVLLAIFQFVALLITGQVNELLLRFGKNLSVFMFDILEFQTFNSEIKPFPFSPWPDEEHGGEWLEERDVQSNTEPEVGDDSPAQTDGEGAEKKDQ